MQGIGYMSMRTDRTNKVQGNRALLNDMRDNLALRGVAADVRLWLVFR